MSRPICRPTTTTTTRLDRDGLVWRRPHHIGSTGSARRAPTKLRSHSASRGRRTQTTSGSDHELAAGARSCRPQSLAGNPLGNPIDPAARTLPEAIVASLYVYVCELGASPAVSHKAIVVIAELLPACPVAAPIVRQHIRLTGAMQRPAAARQVASPILVADCFRAAARHQ